ncbi:hypothetical protein Q3G72_034475 [Acer saccharum]|nr:hypothetical protein Q3G72_034475 [Acer saccharum]
MKAFEKLKNIKLSYSHNLIETPDFTSVPNLEKLNLEGSIQMTYHFTIPSHVHSDHLWLGYLSIQEMIAIQYSDPNDLRCIHVRVVLFRYYPDHDPLNSVADNRSPIILRAKRYGIRMVYESELENFEEFPAGSNIFQHHGDKYLYQILHGLSYLHSLGIILRDLQPAYLLINSTRQIVKIANLVLVKKYDVSACDNFDTFIYTKYSAPELILQLKNYSNAVDMWSVGCIFAEMVLKKPLFSGEIDVGMPKDIDWLLAVKVVGLEEDGLDLLSLVPSTCKGWTMSVERRAEREARFKERRLPPTHRPVALGPTMALWVE